MANVFQKNLRGCRPSYYEKWPTVSLFALLGAIIGQLATGSNHRLSSLIFFLLALGLWVFVVQSTRLGAIKALWSSPVALIAVLVCVVFHPATSKDVNSYALYGRMMAAYDASPYTHTPRDFAADPLYERVSYFWSDSPSVYGPVFSTLSAGIMEVAGSSFLTARLGFQALAALALIATVLLLTRRMDLSMAIALVGLNPLLLTFGVNDAHCDLLVGLGVLAAVIALEAKRAMLAGIAIALAALVKISVLPALAGAAVWAWFRLSRRSAVVLVASGAAVLAVGMLLAGGTDMLEPLRRASARHTRFSLWNPVHQLLTAIFGVGLPTQSSADKLVSTASSAVVASVGLAMIWRHRRDAGPVTAVVAGLVTYQLLGAYVLCWYVAWSLPALALVWRSRVAWVVMAHACWVAIAYLSGYAAIVVVVVLLLWLVGRRKQSSTVAVS